MEGMERPEREEGKKRTGPRRSAPRKTGGAGTIVAVAAGAAALAVLLVLLLGGGSVEPVKTLYPPRGVDVSEYQGRVDWGKVREEGYTFAFVKATEGKDHVDAWFDENWAGAAVSGLTRGAYHFYLFGRTGMEQAENFMSVVPADPAALPPVVDVEMGGSNGNAPDVEAVRSELGAFIDELEKRYGRVPIIYTNQVTYTRLIMGYFPRCPIWMAAPDGAPVLEDGRAWAFWQYTFEGGVEGVAGPVDLNVYNSGDEGITEMVLAEQAAR
jgi:lysozyme